MRITMITATPASVAAGSGTFVAGVGLTAGLRALGHEVTVVRPDRAHGPLGFTAHRFWFNRSIDAARLAGDDWVVGWDMDGYRIAGDPRIRFATYIHGQLADEARFERGAVAFSMRLQARAERRSVRHADRVLTVSEYSRRRLAAEYGRDAVAIDVVPPAFDSDRWADALATATREPRTDSRPTVLCVCRMYPRKDVGTLIRAIARVRRALPKVRLVVIGDGPERHRWERLATELQLREAVTFRGQVDFATLVASFATCDVFCLPSRQEGFGIVLLEAMAAGKPIVACDGTAAVELLDDGRHGVLVPPGEAQAMADALLALLTDADRRARMGELGPDTAARYAPVAVARRFLQVLDIPMERGTP